MLVPGVQATLALGLGDGVGEAEAVAVGDGLGITTTPLDTVSEVVTVLLYAESSSEVARKTVVDVPDSPLPIVLCATR
jgi:hypothetical protein